MRRSRVVRAVTAAFAAVLVSAIAGCAPSPRPDAFEPQQGQEGKDVVWFPTPDEMVQRMLDVAQVAPGDRVVDLGSGDGKIAIAAARRGAIARGIEYDAQMVEFSKRKAKEAGVEVELVQGDIFEADFSNADVVTLYLLTHLNERLRPTLLAMKPGTRVVSHHFKMGRWRPDESFAAGGREGHFWRVPAHVEGTWKVRIEPAADGPTLRIRQQFQVFSGSADWGARSAALADTEIRGASVRFTALDAAGVPQRFEAIADHGGPMMGIVTPAKGGAARLFTATRQP